MPDYLAIVGPVVAVLSLLITARLAWVTKLGPPRLAGLASCLFLYTNEGKDGKSVVRFLLPALWLANTGARPMLVTHLRLNIKLDDGRVIELSPDHSVPMEAIDAANTFKDIVLVQIGLAPFGGFAVLPGERWVNNYAFELQPEEFENLKGRGVVSLAVRSIGKKKFNTVFSQQFDFENGAVNWLNWAGLPETGLSYFHPME